jgi:hypothetical protein
LDTIILFFIFKNYKMYKKIILMALIIVQWSIVNSQSISRRVIANAGGIVSDSNNSISFTIGETVIGTFSTNNNLLTQGFQQGNESGVAGAPITGVFRSCDFTTPNRLSINAPVGSWFSSDTSVARISNNGTVTCVRNGTTNIRYTYVLNGITYVSNAEYVVAAQVQPPNISGPQNICVGATIQLSNSMPNGMWTSIAGRATVNASGVVTGTNSGSAIIQYTVTNAQGCSNNRLLGISVAALPAVPNIAYLSGYQNPRDGCPGGLFGRNKTFGLMGFPSGGTWSATGQISISSSGIATTSNTVGISSVTYSITSGSGCVQSRTIIGTVGNCVGRGISTAKDPLFNDFKIFPNPAKNIVNIKVVSLIGNGEALIIDNLGRVVKQQNLSLGNNAIEITHLSKGMYIVNIKTEQGNKIEKLVIE